MLDWTHLRHRMVVEQICRRGIRDQRVIAAMESVPRHLFVPAMDRERAYEDEPLPIGHGQTISQPYMVACMAEALRLDGSETILEIGAGSGYAAAVLDRLGEHIYAIECQADLVTVARVNLGRVGAARVRVIEGDGTLGYPPAAPYQAISVAAGAPDVPPALIDQLDEKGGRLVIPVGSARDQELRLIEKQGGAIYSRTVTYCRFVPLHGAQGWRS